jgi:hypothetical protein
VPGWLLNSPWLVSITAISFLCWVPNLLAAQLYLQRSPRHG